MRSRLRSDIILHFRKIGIFIVFFLLNKSYSQQSFVVSPPEYIRTIKFYGSGDVSNIPAVLIGKSINLEFDDISAEDENYYYTIEHYSYDWEKTDLPYMDYIEGYQENLILDAQSSFNTTINYTNYKLSIPNENFKIKLSGNYLLKVYTNDKDNPIFTRQFIVYENNVAISAQVKRPNMIKHREEGQQITFSIYPMNIDIEDFTQMKILILQNGNFNIKQYNISPKFVSNNKIVFDENSNIVFKGNSEFRNIDIKDDMSTYANISRVEKKEGMLNFYIVAQTPKKNEEYTISPDINGQFKIRSLRAENQSTESDYAWVYFRAYTSGLSDENQEIYVTGAFNNWKLNEENKMVYNMDKAMYESQILLKQGFYDYTIVAKDVKGNINYDFFDGSSYQTENVYQIIVYYKGPFDNYYKVIGFSNISSESIKN